MSFPFSRDNWLTSGGSAHRYVKWLLAPAILLIGATAYFARKTTAAKPVAAPPSDDSFPIPPTFEPEPQPATIAPLPQLEAALPPAEVMAVDEPNAAMIEPLPVARPETDFPLPDAPKPNEFSMPIIPPSPASRKPVVIPYDPPLTPAPAPVLSVPRSRPVARTAVTAFAVVAITAALVYATFGMMRSSQSAISTSDSQMLQTRATPPSLADAVGPTVDPATLPVTETSESPAPPAEGPHQPAPNVAPAATAETPATADAPAAAGTPATADTPATAQPRQSTHHHVRSRRSVTTSHKTRAFLYKPY